MSQRRLSKSSSRVARAGVIFAAGLAAATFLTGCGSSSVSDANSADNAGGGSTNTAGVATAKADIAKAELPETKWPTVPAVSPAVSLQGKQVMIVPMAGTVSVLAGMADTAKAVMTKLGATVTVCDGKADPTQVANCLQQAQSQHDFAAITLFVSYDMAPNSFQSLAASGTQVLLDGDSPKPDETYPANVQFADTQPDLVRMSQLEAEQAIANHGTGANVIVEQLTDTPDQIAQGQAVADELKKLCPQCTSKVVQISTANADKIASQISAALVSDPDANAITLPVDSWMPETIQGAQAAGRLGKVDLISTGSDVDGLQKVLAGQEAADFGSSVVFDGYELVDGVEREAAGQKVLKTFVQTRDFVKSNVGGLSLTPAAYNTTAWFGTDGFEQNFLKAWGAA